MLKLEAWSSGSLRFDEVGQKELLDIYSQTLEKLHIRADIEESLAKGEGKYTQADVPIVKNWIRIEAGHGVGKTNLASMIVSHFFDCFVPSITTCYAPTYVQVNDLLFKEIRKWRTKNNLQGNILKKPELQAPVDYKMADWWAIGKAVGDSTESIQGQHDGYMLFILDEAEGLPQYLYDAVLSMASGGKCIIILLANPKTTNSPFHELKSKPYVNNFRINCLNHPNVTSGYEKIRGAVTRNYVRSMIYDHCKPYHEMDESRYTFTVDWLDGIWLPDNEFLFRVMGIAPNTLNYNSFFNIAQVENRVIANNSNQLDRALFYLTEGIDNNKVLQIGIDVARQGDDYATIYSTYAGIVKCEYRLQYSELIDFKLSILELLENFSSLPIDYVSIRVDATGNGWGVVDYLNMMDFEPFGYEVYIHPIQNNEQAQDSDLYANKVTEMYLLASKALNDCKIVEFDNVNQLQFELTNRFFDYIIRGKREVKILESKKNYKSRHKNSPDDADGFVLSIVPDEYFDVTPDYGIV